ncbi:hypothetical protein [Tranquillimonas alkanivorans]|uniref:Uncharacterized protein n=1 Tax=Tranquillimonas alkanivorans TaxID=441119 RepID=A0A1I5RHE2_9RHOB|nr:hypothetical protein [Tranquillimonas alkanivorans]SFP57989.1 hypothetical protein SAMN04488047_108180 [Tranquillimonas alkanivorans]
MTHIATYRCTVEVAASTLFIELPCIGELHVSRHSALPSSRPPFVLRDREQHGSEYTLGAGHWQAYFTPASTIRRSNRAWQRQRSGGNG